MPIVTKDDMPVYSAWQYDDPDLWREGMKRRDVIAASDCLHPTRSSEMLLSIFDGEMQRLACGLDSRKRFRLTARFLFVGTNMGSIVFLTCTRVREYASALVDCLSLQQADTSFVGLLVHELLPTVSQLLAGLFWETLCLFICDPLNRSQEYSTDSASERKRGYRAWKAIDKRGLGCYCRFGPIATVKSFTARTYPAVV